MNIRYWLTVLLFLFVLVVCQAFWMYEPARASQVFWMFRAPAPYDIAPHVGEHWDCQVVTVAFDASVPGWEAVVSCSRYDTYLPVVNK